MWVSAALFYCWNGTWRGCSDSWVIWHRTIWKAGLSGTGRLGKLGYLAQDDLESWVTWHRTIRKVGLSGIGRSRKLGYLAQDDPESWVIWNRTIRKVGLSGTGRSGKLGYLAQDDPESPVNRYLKRVLMFYLASTSSNHHQFGEFRIQNFVRKDCLQVEFVQTDSSGSDIGTCTWYGVVDMMIKRTIYSWILVF